jgi:TonB-linked SusC/RagA family outer membrane protein
MEISISGEACYCLRPKRLPTQLLLKMKLTALILIITCMHVSAHSYSQTVSFSGKNVPLQAVFASIEKQTGLSFFFNLALMKDTKPVTLDLRDATLEDALRETLKDQGLDFYRMGKTIFIVKKQNAAVAIMSGSPAARQVDVKGRVTNQQGESLVGASVSVKNGKKGTLTDEKGMFELKAVPLGAMLEVSYLGYEKREVEIGEGDMVRVEMAVANSKLDEVQVIAYGSTTERLSTGNITIVKAVDIEKQPVTNPLLALEGRVPGLFITQSSGLPGSGVTVRIQGQNSLSKGNDPLYVVDGVPYASQLLPTLVNILGGSGNTSPTPAGNGNPLSFINPNDIESIEVLKDADATAIYGSRAANGAILITTKKGKAGKTKADLNLQNGWGTVTRKLDLLNTQQYLQMRNEAKRNDNAAVLPTDYDINGSWDTTRNTDWQKTLIGGTAQYTNAQGSVSGGNATTQFLIGGGYHRETTVFPGDLADQKGNLHFSINNISANQKFRLQLSGNYQIDNSQLIKVDLTQTAIRLAPNAPAIYNADGTLNWAPLSSGVSTWTNPLSYLYNKYQNKTNNLLGNALLSYQLLPGLAIKSSLGYSSLQTNETGIGALLAVAPENRPATNRTASYANGSINSWIVEPQLDYKQIVGPGRLEALIGSTILQNNNNLQPLFGSGYNSDLVLMDMKSATTITVGTTVASVYKYNAMFGRLNYNLQDKYVLDLTARRDGSSRFGPQNLFHNFGSVGATWIYTQEPFVQKTLPFLSFGKLKASYGTTGNDQIGDYSFLNLYSTPGGISVPYEAATGLAPTSLSNPYLEWEETRKLQFGIDLGMLANRVLINADYYYNRSSNQLASYALPYITGFNSITRNFPGTVQNSGWEFSTNTTLAKRKFSWTANINLTLPQNKLVAFPNLATSSSSSTLAIGQPITIVKAFHFLGADAATGLYQFEDSHGNPTSNPNSLTDKTVVINTAPKFYGGFENSFRYKGFELDILFQFVKQKGLNYFFGYRPGEFYGTSNISNQPVSVLNRWQKPGDISPVERFNSNASLVLPWLNASGSSDAAFSDASYIRLKNLSLSWQLPDGLKKKAHLEGCRIYIQGQNLLTFTRYRGLDPENLSTISLPPLRVLTVGIQVTL